MNNTPTRIPAFIINLKRRDDRKAHTIKEFEGRDEFALHIVEALENSNGALGLWSTIRHILLDHMTGQEEFVLIGEDDIEFTEQYSKEYLFTAIEEAQQKQADVLLGGISWFSETVQISENLFWAHSFTGTHFTIIFKKFYHALINTPFRNTSADYKMAAISKDILFMYPFAAVQKDFGYSDATQKNNVDGRVALLFKSVAQRASALSSVKKCHLKLHAELFTQIEEPTSYDNIALPTYVITAPNDDAATNTLKDQFKGRAEFDLNFIEQFPHENEHKAFLLTVGQIVKRAIANCDDVIVICRPNHRFTDEYNKKYLIKNIIEAHEEGADLLFGGVRSFKGAVPLTANRFWVSTCQPMDFMVVYSKFFEKALMEALIPKDETENDFSSEKKLVNSMFMYPFVTVQANDTMGPLTQIEQQAKMDLAGPTNQLNAMQKAVLKYNYTSETAIPALIT